MDRILELYEKMYKDYALSIFEVEIKLHTSRTTRMNGRLQAYFNSSQNRNVFARIMCKAYQTDTPVTITEVCELLNANRSSVSVMVDECEKEGWISVARENNKALCMATDELYEKTMMYVFWKKQISQSIVGDKYKKITQIESVLRSVGVPVPDFSYGEKNIYEDNVKLVNLKGGSNDNNFK